MSTTVICDLRKAAEDEVRRAAKKFFNCDAEGEMPMEFDRIQYNPDGSMTAYSKDGRSYTFGASEPKPKVVSDILEVCSNDPDE